MKSKAPKGAGRRKVYLLLYILAFVIVAYLWETWGILGFLITSLGFAAWRIWKMWPSLITSKHHIETLIWGKPLKTFRPGELWKRKIRLRFLGKSYSMTQLKSVLAFWLAILFFYIFVKNHYTNNALMFIGMVLLHGFYKLCGYFEEISDLEYGGEKVENECKQTNQ